MRLREGLLHSYGAGVGAGPAFSRGGSKKVAASGVEKRAGEETIVGGGIKTIFSFRKGVESVPT